MAEEFCFGQYGPNTVQMFRLCPVVLILTERGGIGVYAIQLMFVCWRDGRLLRRGRRAGELEYDLAERVKKITEKVPGVMLHF